MMPSGFGGPGADEAGVADYIDTFLGAFTFDPPRIWAGGPSSGRHGRRGAASATSSRCRALDELAWRMRIEGSQGLPEREFNGPVVGLQQRYREGLAALGADFAEVDGKEQRRRLRERRRLPRAAVGALLRGHVRRARVRRQPRRHRVVVHRRARATCSRGATATPRCRNRERTTRRHHHRLRPGRRHRGRGAHPRRLVRRDHGEGPQPPPRPRRHDEAVGRLLQRRDQVHLALLPRPRPADRAAGVPAQRRTRASTPTWAR